MISFVQRLMRRGWAVEWDRVRDIREPLRSRGYELAETYGPGQMSSAFDRHRGKNLEIVIESDRGVGWEVVIKMIEPSTLPYDLQIWARAIEAVDGFGPTPREPDWRMWPLEPQLEFLMANLGLVEAASAKDRAVATAKRLADFNRARQLEGFPRGWSGAGA